MKKNLHRDFSIKPGRTLLTDNDQVPCRADDREKVNKEVLQQMPDKI
jgi:hypothetical protein